MNVTAVELAGESAAYNWDPVQDAANVERVTLFEQADTTEISTTILDTALTKALAEHRPNTVAIPGWSSAGALSALRWCTTTSTPAVLMSATTAHDFTRHWWREWPKKRLVSLFDAALVGGMPHRDYLAQLGLSPRRVALGYDAVDNAHFRKGADLAREQAGRLREEYDLPERYVLASARFVPKKNLPRLIRAFARYRRAAPATAWDLVLLGDGAERPAVEAAIQEEGVAGSVHLPGFKQYDDLPVYYGLAEAFVHASTTEQWGLVVNEAMAAGLPVLVSDRCGCAPDLVTEGENGFTFDPYDADALAALLETVAHGAADRRAMGRESRKQIAQWGPERFARGLEEAVESAHSQPPTSASFLDDLLMKALAHR